MRNEKCVNVYEMVFGAVLGCLVAAQSPPITFESPGITVKAFCAELSRQTGRSYEARDEVQGDLLAIRVSGVPVDQVVQQVEFADRAKCAFDGKGYVIRPDAAVRAQLRAACFALRVKVANDAKAYMHQFLRATALDDDGAKKLARRLSDLQAKEDALDKSSVPNASVGVWVEKEAESLRLPLEQALLKMFLAIPAEDLAAIDSNSDAVWSTAPTAMEHQLPLDPDALIGSIRRDESVWHDAAAKYLSPGATQYFGRHQPKEAAYGRIALLRLSCSGSRSGSFVLELTGFDRDGGKLFECVKSSETQQGVDELGAELRGTGGPPPRHEMIPVSSATAKLIRLWSAYPQAGEVQAWRSDREFLNRYFNPERFDPAAETFGRALLDLARARGKQLMAAESGGDSCSLPENCIAKGKLDLAMVEAALSANRADTFVPNEYAAQGDWITVRPRDLDGAATEDFSRTGLGVFLRAARDHGVISLMDVARYAADNPYYFGSRSARALDVLPTLLPGLAGMNLLNEGVWPLKALLGRLDANQIAVAQQPSGLNLASCNQVQLECIWNAFRFERFSYHGKTDVWRSFPTDGLPNGVPGGGVLHLSTTHSPSFRARIQHNGDWIEDGYFTPGEFATRLKRMNADSYTILGFRLAKRTQYNFRFDFPDDTTATENVDDDTTTGREVKTADDLPEPLRSQIKATLSNMGAK
ncbi:MAG: hypothetical protein ACYC96_16220 [Fimbriimonadaceae bacterium]